MASLQLCLPIVLFVIDGSMAARREARLPLLLPTSSLQLLQLVTKVNEVQKAKRCKTLYKLSLLAAEAKCFEAHKLDDDRPRFGTFPLASTAQPTAMVTPQPTVLLTVLLRI